MSNASLLSTINANLRRALYILYIYILRELSERRIGGGVTLSDIQCYVRKATIQ
jgi:hypothetical protein